VSSEHEDDFVYLQVRVREAGLALGRSVLLNVLAGQPSVINWTFEAHCLSAGTDSVLISTGFQARANVDPARDALSDQDREEAQIALRDLCSRLIADRWERVDRFPWETGMPAGPWYGHRYRMTQDSFTAIAHTYPRNVRPDSRSGRVVPWVVAGVLLAALAVAVGALTRSGGPASQAITGAAPAGATRATAAAPTSAPAGSLPSPQPAGTRPADTTGIPPAKSSSPGSSRSAVPPGGRIPSPAVTPAVPAGVLATAQGQYRIRVSWTENSASVTGFHIDNGCSATTCRPGAALTATTSPAASTTFTVTPGTYQCFRAQAFDRRAASGWSGYGCATTPSLTVPGTRKWTATRVYLSRGDALGITAAGQVYIDPSYPQGPAGNPSCTPAVNYAAASATFPAPRLPCWSLVARIGNGPVFEVGTTKLSTATSGRLYLGVNDGDFTDNSGSWTVNIKIGGLPPPA
jgi:hypothetical protein